ncbi:MAG: mechanosensitive ion channel family protein [Oscillospiraceae bacterium]
MYIVESLKFIEGRLSKVFITIIICILVYYTIIHFTKKALTKSKVNKNFHSFIKSLIKISTSIFLVFVILSVGLDINISTFLAAFSVAGLAISLAIKDSLSNVASGLLILLSKPFEKDHFVEIDKVLGNVIEVNLIYTKISSIDNKVYYIPNSEVTQNIITNFSTQKTRKLDLSFLISYQDNIEKAKNIIKNIILLSPYCLKNLSIDIVVSELSSSGVTILSRSWCENENYNSYKFYLNEHVKLAFDKNDITIPFDQLDINIKK